MPELLVLAAIARYDEIDFEAVLEALAAALGASDPQRAREYADGVLDMLPGAAKDIWRKKMATSAYQYQSDFAKGYYADGEARGRAEGEARGRAEGEAGAVLRVLNRRGLSVDDDSRRRIESCTDLDQLDEWIDRAVTVTDVSQLFA